MKTKKNLFRINSRNLSTVIMTLIFSVYGLTSFADGFMITESMGGHDDNPVVVTINSFVVGTITEIKLDAYISSADNGSCCANCFGYEIIVNDEVIGTNPNNQCSETSIDITSYMPITSVSLRSIDIDNYSDAINLIMILHITYTPQCTKIVSNYGYDNMPLEVYIIDFTNCPPEGGIITGYELTGNIGSYCPSWYSYDIIVNDVTIATQQCNQSGFDLMQYLPIYSVKLRSNDENGVGDMIALYLTLDIYYTMQCHDPSEQNETIWSTGAQLDWSDNGNASNHEIEWGLSGFGQGNGTLISPVFNGILTGLSSTVSYDWYVRKECGSGEYSNWIGPHTFTTTGTCGAYTIELIDQDGDGWGSGAVDVFVNGEEKLFFLTLPPETYSETFTFQVNIGDIISIIYYEGEFPWDNEYIIYDEDGLVIAHEGEFGEIPGDIGNPDIPTGLTACIQNPPLCPSPQFLSTTNITQTYARFNWVEMGNATKWDIEWGPGGFTQGNGTIISGITYKPYTINPPFVAGTTYDWYVRSDCGNGLQSSWSESSSFTTPSNNIVQNIDLTVGYQFISSRMIPENPNMLNLLSGNLENLDFVRNTAGLMLRKIGPNWVNSIGDWITTEGYLSKMNADDVLSITGEVINPLTPIPLVIGYQIISFLPELPANTADVFANILDNLDFVRNSAGLMLRKIGPNWVNSIGNMSPGEGYLVKMNGEDILIYPGSSSITCGDPFTDLRDNQTYNTVLIGDKCWMAENLNIGEMINGTEEMTDNGIIEKYCYDNDPDNCEIYGGLYQWNEMMQYTTTPGVQGICPAGWYIPTDDEWKMLEGTVDSQYPVGDPIWNNLEWRGYDAGIELKQNGSSGFEAIFAGANGYGMFIYLDSYAAFWHSSDISGPYAGYRGMALNYANVYRDNYIDESWGFSVRCLKNEMPVNQPEPPSSPNHEDEAINKSINKNMAKKYSVSEGNPYDPIWTIFFEKGLLNIGDEIGVYDGKMLVGAGVVISDNIFENVIPVFSNLYKTGNKPIIKVWDKNRKEEYLLSDYSYLNPYGDGYVEGVFPESDEEYSMLSFSLAGISNKENDYPSLSIYPNPSEGIFNIMMDGINGTLQMKVIGLRGCEYHSSEFEGINTLTKKQLDLTELPAGVYFINFIGKDFYQVERIIIQY